MKKAILAVSMFLFVVAANAQQDSKMATPAASPAPAVQDNKNAPDFKFDVEEFNFGTIKQGEKVSYDFNFANVGKEPLIITEAHGSCGCTVPQWPKEPIAKSAKGMIHVEFNSTGKMGMQDKTVTITSNAKGGAKVLHLKGNVEAPAPVKTDVPAGTEVK
ncbi:MAG: DUF1573 domain-containing protein [Bacteroidetes bacterium]|jgi:hypothetical protein|nr:DUF1573 domain-containing protein [Bacteroidota bacterium]MBP6402748.1 DUF1573 domain-containing protein [Bacteroidia bacterium]MBK6838782.1 DUF1573 domain-containing protein [Bacteroidota bacterium]MBK9524751.1 DUF1573 domain-containing protein [Bacteroidota bacterium]MBK9542919.1 DUF1573 domain-containing protein [Bacteroidota bacterium]